MRKLLAMVLLVLVSAAAATYIALESGGVVVATTLDASGSERQTHIWRVESKGKTYLEAGNPANGWVLDLERGTPLSLDGDGLSGTYTYRIDTSAEGRTAIRALMRQRYGWRDRWISTIFDVTQSRMVEVTPQPD